MSLANLLLRNPEVSVEEIISRDDAVFLEEVSELIEIENTDLDRTAVDNLAHNLITEGIAARPDNFPPLQDDLAIILDESSEGD